MPHSVAGRPATLADAGQEHGELAKLRLLFERLSVALIRKGTISAMEWLEAVYVARHHGTAEHRQRWNQLALLACGAEMWHRIEHNRLRSPEAIRPLLADLRDRLLEHRLDAQLLASHHGFEHAQAETYVKQRRLELASLLLTGCRLPISDIARLLDLGKTEAFSDAFLRWSGLRPSTYRKKYMPHWLRPPRRSQPRRAVASSPAAG